MPKYNPETGELIQDERGAEILDPTPVAPPIGYKRQPSMVEHIAAMVRSERLRQEAEAAGAETWEEADDFDVGDDYDPGSPYEGDFDPIDQDALRAAIDAQNQSAGSPVDGSGEAAEAGAKPPRQAKKTPPPASDVEEA